MKIFIYPYKPAKFYQGKRDCYVYYHYKNPDTGEWEMFKDRGGLNYQYIRDKPKLQKALAKDIADTYNERLKSGWSPFANNNALPAEYDKMRYLPAVEVLDALHKIKASSVKSKTHRTYGYAIEKFKDWMKQENLSHLSIENLRQLHIIRFFDHLKTTGTFANKTINNMVAQLKVVFNDAVARELIIKNPLIGIKKLPEQSGKNFPFSKMQVAAIKKEMLKSDPDLWKFVKCIYHLFVRPVELMQVRIRDIDFRTNQVIIHSSVGKNKRQLPVEIPKSFIKEFKSWKIEKHPEDWFLFGYKLKPGPKEYHTNRVTERHTAILRKCKITDKNYTLYGWKHSGNVDSYLAGVDIWDLMRQNRHHSLEQTEKYIRSMGLRPNTGYSSKAPGI